MAGHMGPSIPLCLLRWAYLPLCCPTSAGKVVYGYVHRRIKLEDSEGYIEVSLRYVPQF